MHLKWNQDILFSGSLKPVRNKTTVWHLRPWFIQKIKYLILQGHLHKILSKQLFYKVRFLKFLLDICYLTNCLSLKSSNYWDWNRLKRTKKPKDLQILLIFTILLLVLATSRSICQAMWRTQPHFTFFLILEIKQD